MNNTNKKSIEEYYVENNLDTIKLIGHDVVFYRKNDENHHKEQQTVIDSFAAFIKLKNNEWLNINTDIVLLFIIEKAIPEIKATDYHGTKVHNEQAEIAKKIQEALLKLRKEKTDLNDEYNKYLPFVPPAIMPLPFYPVKFPPPSSKCSKCGLELSGVMCYSCPRPDCPCGMGSTWCEYRPAESPYSTTITDGTNICCGGNCSSSTGNMT